MGECVVKNCLTETFPCNIENEVKLDFKDVLIRPKRSTLSSRSNVDLIRPFTLRNSRVEYSGVPIIAANMDTTGTFEMAEALGKYDLSVALHKHYSEDEYVAYFKVSNASPLPSIPWASRTTNL